MATVKLKFRPSTVRGREGTLFYLIVHDRQQRQLLSPFRIFQSEWDEVHGTVCSTKKKDREAVLSTIRDGIRLDFLRFDHVIRKLETTTGSYSVDNVADEYRRFLRDYSLQVYTGDLISRLRQSGRLRTAETYRASLSSFTKFLQSRGVLPGEWRTGEVMLDAITPELIEEYEGWQKRRGIVSNTISFYNRVLRAVYNRAVESGVIEDRRPFRRVYTGIDKTVKRALPLPVIKRLKDLDLATCPSLAYARDIFMLSFMMRGMSFVDMAFLRKSDLVGSHLCYRRRKTGQLLTIEWTSEMQSIIDRYPASNNGYLLPIIGPHDVNDIRAYKRTASNVNRNLKRLGVKTGLSVPLTLYVARHSWASSARSLGIPLDVISEGMGHDCETTTQIYLASLDTSAVDRANARLLAHL